MSDKWTKGNWTVRHDADFLQIGVEGDKDVLCCLGLSPAPDWPAKEAAETTANARLISAAPDMAEALADLVSSCMVLGVEGLDPELQAARAALAKARGEQT